MKLLFCLLTATALAVSSCTDCLPTDSDDPTDTTTVVYDTARTDNSFYFTGEGLTSQSINMNGGLVEAYLGDTIAVVIMSNAVTLPQKDFFPITLSLSMPLRRGTYPWENLIDIPSDQAVIKATAIVDHTSYAGIEGTTEVIFANDFTNYVTGRFSGRFASAFGDTVDIVDGQFNGRVVTK